MAGLDPKSVRLRREALGAHVRTAREARGLSQHELGERIGATQSKITRIERGTSGTKIDDLHAIVSCLGIPAGIAAEMEQLAAQTPRQKQWHGKRGNTPQHARRYLDAEPDATLIRAVHSERLPGTLQSEKYLCCQAGVASVAQLTDELANRLERKRLLDEGPRFEYVLSESSLRRSVRGNPSVTRDQINELLRIDERCPAVSIHVLPFDADVAHMPVDFTLLDFADKARNFVYVELGASAHEPKKQAEIDYYHDQWQKLRKAALSRTESRAFLLDRHAALARSSD